MTDQQPQLIFFGDQAVEVLSRIKLLAQQSRTSTCVSRFLRDCADALQILLSELDIDERCPYSRFETILELAEIHTEQKLPNEVISAVLFFIAQFGDLIVRVEKDPSLLATGRTAPGYIIGLCAGLLPAAAAAAARDVSELLRIGRELIAVAFRLGLEQWRSALEIESVQGPWAVAVDNIAQGEVESIIYAFNNDMGGVVISGPPSLFSGLWASSEKLASAPKKTLRLNVPVHAPHTRSIDIEKVLGTSFVIYQFSIRDKAHVISTSTCRPFDGQDLRSVLFEALVDITRRTQNIAGVVDYCVSKLHEEKPIDFVAFGPHDNSFKGYLETAGIRFSTEQPVYLDLGNGLRDGSDLVAVVGMSARLPGSEDLDSFWENLLAGRKFDSEIPESRFDLETHYDATGIKKNTVTSRYGSFLENPGLFDNRLFSISPREAKQMDPMQRILLMCSYEALQMAGYSPEASLSTNRNRIATYFGQTGDDYRESNASQDVDIFLIQGGIRPFAPGRLHYHYKWAGGNYSVDSACAASSTCIILAINALLSRECDTALAGGGSILTAPNLYAGLSRAGFLSKTPGGCKTFREDADGYCRGEGVGLVVLKRLEDAISDNDNVLAVLRRGAKNYSWNSTSITHPSADAQVSAVREVLRNAGVEPIEVGFVEMHGTGTQAGDAIEMEAVSRIFGNDRTKDNPLYVGAVKAGVGHGEAASGVTSLIKAIKMLRHNTIPLQPGFPGPLNPKLAYIDEMNIRIPESNLPFTSGTASHDGKRRILINNFDATGGNNTMLLEDAPVRPHKVGKDPRSYHTVVVSARTIPSLQKNIERLLAYTRSHPKVRLSDLAYTTTARRIHEDLRRSYAVANISELQQLLEEDVRKGCGHNISPVNRPSSIVFTFTGQGSQYAGMGKQLFATSPRFRKTVDSLHEMCKWHGFPSFINLIASGDIELGEYSPIQVQLAITVLELALADLWKSWGIEPDLVIGYSLGEYAALHVAGVLSVHDALYLVGKRALLIQEKCSPGTHAMLAIQASRTDVDNILSAHQSCEISCKGAPRSTVVSGPISDIVDLQTQLKAQGYPCTLLEVPYGFHSPQVDPILGEFREIAESVHFGKPRIPVASTLEGAIVRDEGVFSPSYLANQARKPVDFIGALEACRDGNLVDSHSVWIEIGPKAVLSSFIGATLDIPRCRLLHTIYSKEDNWKTISAATGSAYREAMPLNWVRFHRDYVQFLNLLELPSYAFDLKNFWITTKRASQAEPIPTPTDLPVIPPVPGFPTATLQRVQDESLDEQKALVTFESMTCEPTFLSVVQGHIINGVPLCPASAFMDMAFSAAKYIYQRTTPGSPVPAMSLTNLVMIHPLIPDPKKKPDQVIITKAERETDSSMVTISFSSREGRFSEDHGSCQVHFGDEKEWEAEWSRNAYFINTTKENLIRSAKSGSGHRLHKKVVYKLFANLVLYDAPFQAMEEVFVEEDFSKNAVARVNLPPADSHSFTFSPHWADSLIHVSGFVLNGKPDADDEIFWIASGLGNFRILKSVQSGTPYESYVHIHQITDQGAAHCDVYIFEGDKIVGSSTGIVFQRVTRRVLDVVLGKGSSTGGNAASVKPVSTTVRAPQARFEVPQSGRTSPSLSNSAGSGSETPVTSVDGDDAEDVIAIILANTGFDPADVEPFTQIADMGLDSILSIEIIGEIKKSLGIELPASFFTHHVTVADVRNALGNNDRSVMKLKEHNAPAKSRIVAAMPDHTQAAPCKDEADMAMEIILAKTGFDPEDVEPFTRISDMGLDSILTIEVIAELRNNIGLELPASFFSHYQTVADVKKALGHDRQQSAKTPSGNHTLATCLTAEQRTFENTTINKKLLSSHHSNVVLLQGRADSDKIPLFLIADGGGSATSYVNFPPLFSGDNPVYGCESPFLNSPEDFTYTIEEVSDLYAAAIRNIQPHGPYLLGGWSLGGLFAFEVSRRFINAGEVVQGLFVLDFKFPAPLEMRSQTVPTMETVEMIGIANGVNVPSKGVWAPATYKAKLHSLQSLRATARYVLQPMKLGRTPLNTYVIWAGLGLETLLGGVPPGIQKMLKLHLDPSNDFHADTMLLWFFGKRQENEGPDGWDVATQSIVHCSSLPCDHFTMVNKPFAEHTGKHLRGLISQCLTI
ncbi:polyketide synthase [Trichoderma arundinaceum]|uniref:Polyketide synthase n=1 Tax=Trichoderma arundinaceum TaxID=490622 RepID=A0A395NU54_TRIAR|nr:polyketide synthase [Trichoderma arundinaceum]